MNDITICVLASSKKIKRLQQFLEIGLSFSKKYNHNIVFLADETEEKPNFVNYKWEKIKGPISCRFSNYLMKTNELSRWFLQVDDDSCTDIDKTLEIIDSFYDNCDPVLLHGSCFYSINGKAHGSFFMEKNLQNIIKKMNIENFFIGTEDINEFEIMPRFKHSWEQTMVSSSAVNKIKNCKRVIEFLDLCMEETPEYGDQVPYIVAKIAKIPIDENFIFCPLPIASEYSAINKKGRYTHIHHVLSFWDELKNFKEIIKNKKIFEDKKSTQEALENKSLKETFWYFEKEEKTQGIIKLEKSGKIEIYNKNECFWEEKDEKLLLLDSNKKISIILNRKMKNFYEGFCLNTGQKIILNKIDIISLIGMNEIKKLYE